MTNPIASSPPESSPQSTAPRHNASAWYRPTWSPEHGVYVVLWVAFLTGAAAAQRWTGATTLGLICAFCGFQAEHPLILQIRQRSSLKPRFLVWGGLYGGIALAIALYLAYSTGAWLPLLLIYSGAMAALVFDGVSTLHRNHKTILNEGITFAAVCLAAPFAYSITMGSISQVAIGLWILNTLFFCSSIFTVKLRKLKRDESLSASVQRVVIYHLVAIAIVAGSYTLGFLPGLAALAFGIVLCKVGFILWQQQWYCDAPIQSIATIETLSAFLFWAVVSLSVLPAQLT